MNNNPKKKKQPMPQNLKAIDISGKKREYFIIFMKWMPLAIIVFTALLYYKAIFNGFCIDDSGYVYRNPDISNLSLHGLKTIFSSFYVGMYEPLSMLTYLCEYTWSGLHPLSYHLTNILFHLINIYLVYTFIVMLSGKKVTALIVSLLFAVHPMHVESVAWISERKDVVYSFFYLLSSISFIRYIKSEKNWKHYLLAFSFFICALLSKSAAVTLPVLLIVLVVYINGKISRKHLLKLIPFFLLSLLFGIISFSSQQSAGTVNSLPIKYSFFERIFLLSYSVSFYLVKLVAPFYLSCMHYYPEKLHGMLPWQYYASLPFLLFIITVAIKCKPLRREIVFGALFFLVTISVMLQFISFSPDITAERYTYISYIGLFFIVGQWFSFMEKKRAKIIFFTVLVAMTVLFSYQTWIRINAWKNDEALYADVIKKNKTDYRPYWTRGSIRRDNNNIEGALLDYNNVLMYNPNYVPCIVSRGFIYYQYGNFQEAIKDMNLAIELDSTNLLAYNGRGIMNNRIGNINMAIKDYSRVIQLSPESAEPYNNRGYAYLAAGDFKSAFHDYNNAIFLAPESPAAYINRSNLFEKTGDLKKAIRDINKVISIQPADANAYYQRGHLKTLQKDYKGSIADFTYSIKLKDNDYNFYVDRGFSRLNLKDTTGACQDWEKASSLGYADGEKIIRQYCHK